MAKGPWEKRVGQLLQTFCPWVYKPPDTQFHGGSVRIDYLASDWRGVSVMVEVKQLSQTRKSLNLMNPDEMRPLQIAALNDHAQAKNSITLLMVGKGSIMYVWGWRQVWGQYQWRLREEPHQPPTFKPSLLQMGTALGTMFYKTDKDWLDYGGKNGPLLKLLLQDGRPYDLGIARTLNGLAPLSLDPERYAWIMKQGDCIHTLPPTQQSGRLSANPVGKVRRSLSSESSRTGGMKPLPTVISER